MNKSNNDVMCRGMDCLVERLGIVEAEQFVYLVKADQFDYTEWQRKYFDTISREELDYRIKEYAKAHPFQGDRTVII